LRSQLGFGQLEQAPLPFYAVATDLAAGEAVVLAEGDVVQALMASAAIPGVFPPVEMAGRLLVDGSVVADSPVSQAGALGASTVYLLPTVSPADDSVPRGALDVATRALLLSAKQMAAANVAEAATRLEVRIVPPPPTAGHSIFDFGRTTELIDRGYLRAQAWLEEQSSTLVA
jgi:NTE family protein